MVGPAIRDGVVLVSGKRIKAVGRWRDLARRRTEPPIDLGEVVLMPGLINSHCHLDYTNMAGQFASPKHFTDWLKLITTTKAQWSTTEYRESWLAGAQMLLRTGSTTVADIEAVPQLLPGVWEATPLRVISLLEMIGLTSRRLPQTVLQQALDTIAVLDQQRCRAGLSPHAPYSTVGQLLRMSAQAAKRRGCLLCTHVAESATEFEMFKDGRGDMYEWLRRSGRDMADCGTVSPVEHLDRWGFLRQNLLATHVNYLARADATLLARRRVSVVHCPRSHAFFRHAPFQLKRLLRAGVNVCIGTDSLATVLKHRRESVELDLFAEMRLLANNHPWLSPGAILRMATVHGALAVGRPGLLGELSPGAHADLIALRVPANKRRVADAVLEHQGAVAASMIDGQWALPPA